MSARTRWAVAVVLFAAALAALTKNFIDLRDVQVTYAEAPEKIADALRGMKIMFLSDIHVRRIGTREKFVLRLVDELRPDYIFISGDFKPFRRSDEPSLEFFRMLKPKRAAYAVLGDAEYREGYRNCVYCHAPGAWAVRDDLPVKVLRDQIVTLDGPDGPAVDLWGGDGQKGEMDFSWTGTSKSGRPVIALDHYPTQIGNLSAAGADLILSGDTHGGQAWGGDFLYNIILRKYDTKFLRGRFLKGKTVMWVNRGLGWSLLPIRIGVKPEVIIFDFSKP